jgi:hypothetical protein
MVERIFVLPSYLEGVSSMAKATHKDASRKSRLSSWAKEWWRWLKSRERQTISRRWNELQFLSVIAFISVAIFGLLVFVPPYSTALSRPGALEQVGMMIAWAVLGVIGLVFIVSCAAVFGLSFHPKTRRFADGYFHFRDLSKVEELEMRVDKAEGALVSVNGRLDSIEQRLVEVERRLDNIDSKLGSIEITLEALASRKAEG